ncbi:MAG: hypothetical protein KGJ13_06130 [Patescibacteria group bacterium]|nr:hypothetical protein [Patescibacteria group bacterium]
MIGLVILAVSYWLVTSQAGTPATLAAVNRNVTVKPLRIDALVAAAGQAGGTSQTATAVGVPIGGGTKRLVL